MPQPGATPSSATKDVGLVTEAFPPQVMEKMPPARQAIGHGAVLHHGLQHGAERTAFVTEFLTGRIAHRPQRQRGERQGNSGEADALWAGLLRQPATARWSPSLIVLQDHPPGGFAHWREGGLQAAGGGLLPGGCWAGAGSWWPSGTPNGYRPLCLGENGSGVAVASESCALDSCGFRFVRDIPARRGGAHRRRQSGPQRNLPAGAPQPVRL